MFKQRCRTCKQTVLVNNSSKPQNRNLEETFTVPWGLSLNGGLKELMEGGLGAREQVEMRSLHKSENSSICIKTKHSLKKLLGPSQKGGEICLAMRSTGRNSLELGLPGKFQ